MILQGSFKAICRNLRMRPGQDGRDMIVPPCGMPPRVRERFLANRNDRGATCLSPKGEFVAKQ